MTRDPQKLGPVVWAVRRDPPGAGWDGRSGTSRPPQTQEKVGTEELPQSHQPWPQSWREVLEDRSALIALAAVWLTGMELVHGGGSGWVRIGAGVTWG